MDQLPRLGKRELICLLSFACNYVVFVWRGFLFLWVLGMGYVILLWHSLSLPYNCLVDAKYRNAKEYWKLLKDAANLNTSAAINISSNKFAEYFKATNNPDDNFFSRMKNLDFFNKGF